MTKWIPLNPAVLEQMGVAAPCKQVIRVALPPRLADSVEKDLSAHALEILNRNRSFISHFYLAARQQQSMDNRQVVAVARPFPTGDGKVRFSRQFGQDILSIEIYPAVTFPREEEEDERGECLLVIWNFNRIFAVPMAGLETGNLKPIYRYLGDIEQDTPNRGSSHQAMQFKFPGARDSFICSQWYMAEPDEIDRDTMRNDATRWQFTTNKFENFFRTDKSTTAPPIFNGSSAMVFTETQALAYADGEFTNVGSRGTQIGATYIDEAGTCYWGFGSIPAVHRDGTNSPSATDILENHLRFSAASDASTSPNYTSEFTSARAAAWSADPSEIGTMAVGYSNFGGDSTSFSFVTVVSSAGATNYNNPTSGGFSSAGVGGTFSASTLGQVGYSIDATASHWTATFDRMEIDVDVNGVIYPTLNYYNTTPESQSISAGPFSLTGNSDALPGPGIRDPLNVETSLAVLREGRSTWANRFSAADQNVTEGVFTGPYYSGSDITLHSFPWASNGGVYASTHVNSTDADTEMGWVTPFESGTGSYGVTGWLQLANGEHAIIGYSAANGKRLVLDGDLTFGDRLAEACGVSIERMNIVLMDIPLRKIKEMSLWTEFA